MSTPYGPVDPNIIALNRQLRERQAQIDAERAAEAARLAEEQRQQEERRREQERRESVPVRRVETLSAGRESTNDFAQFYERFLEQGYDPRDAFSLASARAAQSELAKEGKVFTGQTLYVTDTEVRGITEYRESRASEVMPLGVTEAQARAKVGEIIGGKQTPFGTLGGIRGPVSYTISKDQFGNVTDIAVYSTRPDINAMYANLKNQFQARPLRYEIGLSDTIGISDVANRPGGVRTYAAEKIPLGRQPGQNVRYLVELQEEINLSGRKTPPADQFFYDPTNPFKVTKGIDIPVSEGPRGGFREGFSAVYENVGEFGASGLGLAREPKYKPEAEAPALGAVLNIPFDIAGGKPVGEAIQRAETDLRLLGQEIMRNPEYFAGSIAGSVAFAGATLGAGPLAKLAASGGKGIAAITYARVLRPVGVRATPIISELAARTAPPFERLAAIDTRSAPLGSLGRRIAEDISIPVSRPLKSLIREVDLATIGPRVRAAERVSEGITRIELGLEKVAGPVERLAYTRIGLPESVRTVFEPVAAGLRETGDMAAVPFREAGGRGFDVYAGLQQRVQSGIEPLYYASLKGQEEFNLAAGILRRGISTPFERLPFATFKGAGEIKLGARLASEAFIEPITEPYQRIARKVRNELDRSTAILDADIIKFTKTGRTASDVSKLIDEPIMGLQRTGRGRAVFDIGTETSESRFARGIINLPEREVTLITREPLAAKELEKAAAVTKYTTEIRATEITGLKQSLVKGGDILDLSTTEMLPKTVKSAVPDLPILSKSPVIRFEKTAFEGLPRAAKEPVPIAAALTYESGDLTKFARAIAKEPKEPLRGSQIDDLLGLPGRKSKPFDFSEQVAESITPAAKERAIDRTVSDLISVPAMEKGISSEFSKFLGPAAITGTSLGLGGATGQERKGRRSLIEETSESIIAYPSSVQVSPLARTLQKDLIRSSSTLGIDQSSILRFDLGAKFGFGQVGRQRFELKTDLLPKTIQRETSLFSTAQDVNFSLFQGTRQTTRSAFSTPLRLSIPTPFRTRTGFPIINFGFDKPRKGGKRKGRKRRYSERAFPAIEIFPGTALSKYLKIE